jgi:hypothetical protein
VVGKPIERAQSVVPFVKAGLCERTAENAAVINSDSDTCCRALRAARNAGFSVETVTRQAKCCVEIVQMTATDRWSVAQGRPAQEHFYVKTPRYLYPMASTGLAKPLSMPLLLHRRQTVLLIIVDIQGAPKNA